ncbi:flagellar L-ring protein [Mesorhizobium sp. L-8-10]|uniref:flagellar basal body L-ring protein FlgH n=1 Tax=Mesorhizobium sp. L-8-10 TaxID=2744523 RepID=UPI001928BBEF|nr:flagellar basal body L-ring protein FlgH [Mesorhizobium sp. L-8-10]BCH30960.1 flagellar L-ring protein [Mesorhizobium sp. L-8-10]
MRHAALLIVAAAGLSGCSQSLNELGTEPRMSAVGSGLQTTLDATSAYPSAPVQPVKRYSLWDDRQAHFFTDARALNVGDILTVFVLFDEKAQFNNQSDRRRKQGRKIGFEAEAKAGGNGSDVTADMDLSSSSTYEGDGATVRSEKVRLSVAAVVTDVLPNGNLIIRGTQEIRVNFEMRVLTIAGIVRPADIDGANTIPYERIAEARISYGGRGRITEVQQPTWGKQLVDAISPI